ncbi:Homeodomain-like superfamily protein [Abeliophyllum distichum]|uniref:Homeodomain-like superfamily protein n=1 Tax=Abeliophyllum distichum TaxID=126358 RepID=A0ABD1UQM1_9LAMI
MVSLFQSTDQYYFRGWNPMALKYALTLDIRNSSPNHNQQSTPLSSPPQPQLLQTTAHSFQPNSSVEFDSAELGGSGRGGDGRVAGFRGSVGSKEPTQTLKQPRLVWTPQLDKRFVDVVAHLGIKNAVLKTINWKLFQANA